jgi:ribonuclease VapC
MIFVDASAIVAILTREPEDAALAAALDASRDVMTSPIAVYEAALGICRKRHSSVAEAEQDVDAFLDAARIRVIPVADNDRHAALDAFSRYGKGTGHPAQLNLGDCFAYAAAKNQGAALLFKGDDFSKTDIERWNDQSR